MHPEPPTFLLPLLSILGTLAIGAMPRRRSATSRMIRRSVVIMKWLKTRPRTPSGSSQSGERPGGAVFSQPTHQSRR